MANAKDDDQLVALRAELEALRGQVTALDQEIRRAQQHVDLTMRGQLRCRACQCRRIAHAMKVLDRADGDARKELALYQPTWWSSKTQGQLQAYVCTKCGLVEWWVSDPGSLQEHDEYLRILDGEALAPTSPYR